MTHSKVGWLFLFLLGSSTSRDGAMGFWEELGLRLRLGTPMLGSCVLVKYEGGSNHSSQRRNPEMAIQ